MKLFSAAACLLLSLSPALPQQATISFIGDCTIGNDVRTPEFDRWFDSLGPAYFFSGVKSVLAADDYTVANLETAIIDSGTPIEKQFRFRGKPPYLEILRMGSVEAVTLANNHSWDYGDSGYAQTQRNLDRYGIDYFAYDKVLIREINGLRFAFFGQSFFLQDSALVRMRSLRDSVDFIVAVIHWGKEKEYRPNAGQKRMAAAMVRAGADLVVGHHPHVLQPLGSCGGKPVAYSIGNFVFGGNRNPKEKRTVILQVRFEKEKPPAVTSIPCRISSVDSLNDFRPVPVSEYPAAD